MALVLLILVLATGLGLALGGHPRGFARLRVRLVGLVALAALVQLLGLALASDRAPLLWAVLAITGLLTGAFVVANVAVPGVGLIGTGLVLNLLVVAANGGMPVLARSVLLAGVDPGRALADPVHVPVEGARLAWLGDVVPVLNPLHREVVSIGDLLVAAGIGLLVVTGMRRGRRAAPPPVSPSPAR
ncbi:MAG TPA: DUF5317 family protein [Actinomycetes bacterium]|nr:DUF5317 family protein [Actinomycetes bacterium]